MAADQFSAGALHKLLLEPRHTAGRRSRPCNSSHSDRPLVSAIIQTFRDGANARQLLRHLHKASALTSHAVEVLVNDDSRSESAAWLAELTGPNDFLLSSPNVHEIRAYNRLARLARGDYLILLQGDHCLPPTPAWLRTGLGLFAAYPRLGLLGGQMGFNQVPFKKIAESVSWGVEPCRPIPFRVPAAAALRHEPGDASGDASAAAGSAFMFVAGVNIGPLLVRREAYLLVGGFDEAFSCAGAPGIQLDTDLSLRMWEAGYQVGLFNSAVSNGVGGRKTRKNKAQKRLRRLNDAVNGERCERRFAKHDAAAVAAANAQLERVAAPEQLRARELKQRVFQEPSECRADG
jgi:GT2 family glycosyltransferase